MGPDAGQKAADVLLNQGGVLGAMCVFLIIALIFAGLVIRKLYADVQACNAVSLDDRRELIKAVEAAKEHAKRSEDASKSLQQTLELRVQGIADISRQIDINSEKLTHGFGNLGQTLESFVRLVERERAERERIERERDRAERERAERGRP